MFLTKLKIGAVLALVVALAGAGAAGFAQRARAAEPTDKPAATAPGQPKPDRPAGEKPAPGATKPAPDGGKKPTVGGVVRSVDAGKGTVTVAVRKLDEAVDRTFEAGKDTEIVLDGRAGKLADLKPGFRVTLRLSADHKAVLQILVEGPVVRGEVKAVDAAKGTLVLGVATSAGPREMTFELAKDVKVSVEGHKNAALADVKVGSGASLTLTADRAKAVAVHVGPEKKVGDGTKGDQAPVKKKGDR